jgi:hypothetical protein
MCIQYLCVHLSVHLKVHQIVCLVFQLLNLYQIFMKFDMRNKDNNNVNKTGICVLLANYRSVSDRIYRH